jgi:hypothetical protein
LNWLVQGGLPHKAFPFSKTYLVIVSVTTGRYLVTEGDEDTSSGSLQLLVENGIEDGVVVLHVLHQKWVSETKCCRQKTSTYCVIKLPSLN